MAASIGAVLGMADMAFKLVFKYVPAVKNARKDVEDLMSELRLLSSVLYSLKQFAQVLEEAAASTEKVLRMEHMESCCYLLSKIRSDLESAETDFNSKNIFKGLQRKLRWPFDEQQTTRWMENLRSHKQTINLALTTDSMSALLHKLSRYEDTERAIADVGSDVKRILDITRRIDMNSKRREVLKFFMRHDPQGLFETSVTLRHPFTGLWFTQGDRFRDWMTAARSRLWLGGIPGAGKTVLAAAMVEQVLSVTSISHAVGYFFCDSSQGSMASVTDILGALACQFAQQSDEAYEILEQYYSNMSRDQGFGLKRAATKTGLVCTLLDMLHHFERTYIIVDGIDEQGRE